MTLLLMTSSNRD